MQEAIGMSKLQATSLNQSNSINGHGGIGNHPLYVVQVNGGGCSLTLLHLPKSRLTRLFQFWPCIWSINDPQNPCDSLNRQVFSWFAWHGRNATQFAALVHWVGYRSLQTIKKLFEFSMVATIWMYVSLTWNSCWTPRQILKKGVAVNSIFTRQVLSQPASNVRSSIETDDPVGRIERIIQKWWRAEFDA